MSFSLRMLFQQKHWSLGWAVLRNLSLI